MVDLPPCLRCKRPIGDTFYLGQQGLPVCLSCHDRLGIVERPNTLLTFLRTLLHALTGAVLSGIIAGGLTWITGYSLSIAWIFLGSFIGIMVRRACARSPHLVFRLMAVLATYLGQGLSIVFTYLVTSNHLTDLDWDKAPALLMAASIAPAMVARHSPISILIYGYGLLQAWKASARGNPDFAGPFSREQLQSEPAAEPQTPEHPEAGPDQALSEPEPQPQPQSRMSGLGGIALLAWKAKAILGGLAKLPTLLTMFASVWAYATLWGWPFALGFVLCIYLHEMGHVIELRRLGFQFSAPIFIPGLGAQIMLRERWTNPVDDARIGLAGPNYGLISTLICWAIFKATGNQLFSDLTETAALLNLFNLVPLYPLDGGRAIRALNRGDRIWVLLAGAAAYIATENGLLILFLLVGAYQTWRCSEPRSHTPTLINYVLLIFALTAFVAHLI